jgi:hypothetical protein
VPPGSVYPSALAFAEAWNQNVAGTGVPTISRDDATDIDDGPSADTVLVRLSSNVGLLGVVRNDDQSLAEVILVWVPGGDEAASNQLYRNAFDVMVRTLDPSLDQAARTALAGNLGLSSSQPPFADGATASARAGAQLYTLGVRADVDASYIAAVDGRPR